MDEMTLYYTFSTIAQTLAAAFAFVGAFVLFRLQGINQENEGLIRTTIERFKSYLPNPRNFISDGLKAISSKKYDSYLETLENEYINTRSKHHGEIFENDYPECKRVRKNVIDKKEIILNFRHTAILIGSTVILSVVFLPFSKMFANFHCIWPVLILILIITLTAISIILSIELIFRTLSG